MATKKLAERKFSSWELKQINAKKYLSWKCTRKKVIEGNKTDFALFTLGDTLVHEHHSVGISPVIVSRTKTELRLGYKVVVSFIEKDVAKRFSAIAAPSVTFVVEGSVDSALYEATRLANAQNHLLWTMPEGTVRTGAKRRRKTTV
jgi:hypothetical protein